MGMIQYQVFSRVLPLQRRRVLGRRGTSRGCDVHAVAIRFQTVALN